MPLIVAEYAKGGCRCCRMHAFLPWRRINRRRRRSVIWGGAFAMLVVADLASRASESRGTFQLRPVDRRAGSEMPGLSIRGAPDSAHRLKGKSGVEHGTEGAIRAHTYRRQGYRDEPTRASAIIAGEVGQRSRRNPSALPGFHRIWQCRNQWQSGYLAAPAPLSLFTLNQGNEPLIVGIRFWQPTPPSTPYRRRNCSIAWAVRTADFRRDRRRIF